MAGIDEASARSALGAMQDRLARDPVAALGIGANATIEELRSAFLELTKTFHPVRFGRMATDVQKLSNEVFLALRAAHDALAKALRRQSGPIATARVGSSSVPGTQPVPALPPTQPPAPIPGHAHASGTPPGARPAAPPPRPGMALVRPKPNDTGDRAAVQAPSTSDSEARGLGAPAAAPAGRGLAAAGAPPSSAGAKVAPRTAAPHVASRPIPTLRTAAPAQPVTPRDESAVLDLLNRQLWDQARTALHQLAARDPASKKIRALACYARGREAQLDGRVDDARVELQDALELDPDLQLAKTALTELFTRRK